MGDTATGSEPVAVLGAASELTDPIVDQSSAKSVHDDALSYSSVELTTNRRSRRDTKLSLKAKERKAVELNSNLVKTVNELLTKFEYKLSVVTQSACRSEYDDFLLEIDSDLTDVSDTYNDIVLLSQEFHDNKLAATAKQTHACFCDEVSDIRTSVQKSLETLLEDAEKEKRMDEELEIQRQELERQIAIFNEMKQRREQNRMTRATKHVTQPISTPHLSSQPPIGQPSASLQQYRSAATPDTLGNSSARSSPVYQSTTILPTQDINTARQPSLPDQQSLLNKSDLGIVQQLSDNVARAIQKRQAVPPGVFSGDVMEFADWEVDLDEFLDAENIMGEIRLRHLKKYVTGEAKKCIEGHFEIRTYQSYLDARSLLKERYGNKKAVTRTFRKRLADWPKINGRDGKALRDFGDFLFHIESAMKSNPGLNDLNSEEENAKMNEKLPPYLQDRWARTVGESERKQQRYPTFSEFVAFVKDEAFVKLLPISQGQTTNIHAEKSNNNRASSSGIKTTRNYQTSTNQKKHCVFCNKDNHDISECFSLGKKPYPDRLKWAREHRLCFSCLRVGHQSKQCRLRATCQQCKKSHPTLLHDPNWKGLPPKDNLTMEPVQLPSETDTNIPQDSNNDTTRDVRCRTAVLSNGMLSMMVPVYISADGKRERLIYALLDTQSDACFITKEIADYLKPQKKAENLTIHTLNGRTESKTNKYQGLQLRGYLNNSTAQITAYEQDDITCYQNQIPTTDRARNIDHLAKIADQLPPLLDIPVGLLIGMDCPEALAPLECVPGGPGQTFAIRTMFGWTLCGGKAATRKHLNSKLAATSELLSIMERDFQDVESTRSDIYQSQEDKQFIKIMETSAQQDGTGNYVMPLPFRKEVDLPDNRSQAQKRLEGIMRKFKSDSSYYDEYKKFMDGLINAGHAEEIPSTVEPQPLNVWYLPHFSVRHKQKQTLRVVFDASAKYKGIALNDLLLSGPDHINSLLGVLIRFRQEPIAITCDIQQMFYNFKVQSDHRDFLRFLWVGNDLETVKEYRMSVHLFGATSSPAVATFGLRRLADDYKMMSPDGAKFLQQDFYVDDGVKSVATVEEAIDLIEGTTNICRKANIRLHKFLSNSKEVLASVPKSERSESTKDLDLFKDHLPEERTLGMKWAVEEDSFHYAAPKLDKPKPTTKRGLLATVAQMYDPMGLISPIVLKGKLILQKVVASSISWDEPLEVEDEQQWKEWLSSLKDLDQIQLPRCVKPTGTRAAVELHHFCDASQAGYGACSYLKQITKDGKINCNLLISKARVAPLQKATTIPRLELQGAVTAVKLANIIRKELNLPVDREVFWTDSQIVLGYIKNESKRFHVFVANRVAEIRQSTTPEQWQHVKTTDNPADIASRGCTVAELQDDSKWYNGPPFLTDPDVKVYIEQNQMEANIDNSDPEVRSIKALSATTSLSSSDMIRRFNKFSDWNRLVKSIAILKQIAKNRKWKTEQLNRDHLKESESFIISTLQTDTYPEILQNLRQDKKGSRTNTLAKLNPLVDKAGVIRVGGRLTNGPNFSQPELHPAIIPKNSHISKLIIKDTHNKIHHLGQRSTLAAVREAGFWVTHGKATVRSVLATCVDCMKLRKPPETQLMGDLPSHRIEQTPPFTHVGMDVFGPFQVKERRTELKRYGLLFTCLYSRAVHIELLEDLSTDAFLNALRCFTALRGKVDTLYSDCGTNFIGARNELENLLDSVKDTKIREYLLQNKTEFRFNTPKASHQGGIWERLIRSARAVLDGMAIKYKGRMDTQTLRTAFYEAMAVMNSSPLSGTTIDDPDERIITPGHLLTMKLSHVPAPPPGKFDSDEIYGRVRWRKAQQFAEEFWQAWKSEYMIEIDKRQRWTGARQNLKEGDIVLVRDDDLPRNAWKMAVVENAVKSKDGLVRKVALRVANKNITNDGKVLSPATTLERPVQKVVLILRA